MTAPTGTDPAHGAHAAGRDPSVADASVGDLMGNITRDLSTLMRQELELAKAELKQEAKNAGTGAGMLGAAGLAGYMVLVFLSCAVWWGLDNVMDAGLAALLVAIAWGLFGAVMFALGRERIRKVKAPEQTINSLKDTPGALTGKAGKH